MARNPQVKPYRVLGFTLVQWNAIKANVTALLNTNDDQETIADAAVRATDPALVSDRVWNQIKNEMGL